MTRLLFILPMLFYLISPVWAQDIVAIPNLTERVNDTTGTLNTSEKQDLENRLIQFEQENSKGAQIVILIISTTGTRPLERYAEFLSIQNRLSDKTILLLISKQDKIIHIESGGSLKGIITEDFAEDIIKYDIAPSFEKNKYHRGITKALNTMIQTIHEGERPFFHPKIQRFLNVISILYLIIYVGLIICYLIWKHKNPSPILKLKRQKFIKILCILGIIAILIIMAHFAPVLFLSLLCIAWFLLAVYHKISSFFNDDDD